MCPYCAGFKYKLEAWEKIRSSSENTFGSCDCVECEDPSGKWRTASESPSDVRKSFTCGKSPHEGLELPSQPGVVPEFVKLGCSLLSKTRKGSGGESESYTYPEHIELCGACGWDKIAPSNCPVDMSDEPVTWTQKQDGMGPKGESIYCDYTGTRRELVEAIRCDLSQVGGELRTRAHARLQLNHHLHPLRVQFLNHIWLCQWIAHQFNLDYETFKGICEIIIVTDFSAVYKVNLEIFT
jgi:hypothetical protein